MLLLTCAVCEGERQSLENIQQIELTSKLIVSCDRVREKKVKLVRELVSKYYLSELVSNFTHQNFLVKVVRLLGVVCFFFFFFFFFFHQIDSPK
jgi:hypothetical protein